MIDFHLNDNQIFPLELPRQYLDMLCSCSHVRNIEQLTLSDYQGMNRYSSSLNSAGYGSIYPSTFQTGIQTRLRFQVLHLCRGSRAPEIEIQTIAPLHVFSEPSL